MDSGRGGTAMKLKLKLNGIVIQREIEADMVLLDFLREQGCYSVKRGCETSNCGLCTVLADGKPILSCSMLAARAEGMDIITMEGILDKGEEIGRFLAAEGAEQCGYCSPGFIMNVIAMERELENPDIDSIKEYMAGNLCRCSGYMGQLRAVLNYLEQKGRK